ncbi:hypothetical protein PS910_01472 [Pseudomonas fluorescens]|nr:hypothetical protein PS910_01472 [Pseudomonas fluorescens]
MTGALLTRYRLPLAWTLIGLLLLILGIREGLAQWRVMTQWQALAETAASLPDGPAMSLERLRHTAEVRAIRLAEFDTHGSSWQLRGHVSDARTLQAWLQALQSEGARISQWALEQDTTGLRFDVQVQP